jgi:signal transduction histidine kinase
MRIAGDKGVVGWVVQNGIPATVNDAATDERFNSEVDQATDFSTRSILCVPLRVNDEVIGALEVVNKKSSRGFSERDMALAEAIASQAAEALQRARLVDENMRKQRLAAIGETVAGLAHCIRNILNGLKGGAYMVNSGLKNNTKDHLERGWDMVQRNIEHVSDLALGMLDYSKDRAPVLEQADANELLEEIVRLTEEKARSRGVSLALEAGSDVVPFRFDAQSVRRCVMNLVSNAIDACEEKKGRVTLRTRVPDERWVELSVTDNGCGMSPETKNKLFTSFFSTKGSKGTGLGLPVTRKILREHGGDLLVESEQGRGSTFTCRLPFRTQD